MKFTTKTVLSVTHDVLLTRMEHMYSILNYMTDDNLYTHQLPRAARFCKDFILKQHPQLKQWDEHKDNITPENYLEYVAKAKEMFGESLEIDKLPDGLWVCKSPIEELSEIMQNRNEP